MKKDLTRIFIDEINSKPLKKNFPTNRIKYNHIFEIWSIDLADMVDFKISNNKGFRYIFTIFDNISKYLWAIPLKIKNSNTIINEVLNILLTSKRSRLKIESDRGTEFYNNIFQSFLKIKYIPHYSRFTDEGPSRAEGVIRTIRNLLKKPISPTGNADRLSELSSVNKQNNNTNHNSTKMTPIQASKNSNEKKSIPIFKIEESNKSQNLN